MYILILVKLRTFFIFQPLLELEILPSSLVIHTGFMLHLSLFLFFCPKDRELTTTLSTARTFLYVKITYNHSSVLLSPENEI